MDRRSTRYSVPRRGCLAGAQTEGMDELPVAHVAHDRPAELEDLLFVVVFEEFVHEFAIDIRVVDVEAFGIVEGRFFGGREDVGIPPGADLCDELFFEGVTFP
jgi:hypothetical protein